jgi:hypothetical protein
MADVMGAENGEIPAGDLARAVETMKKVSEALSMKQK